MMTTLSQFAIVVSPKFLKPSNFVLVSLLRVRTRYSHPVVQDGLLVVKIQSIHRHTSASGNTVFPSPHSKAIKLDEIWVP